MRRFKGIASCVIACSLVCNILAVTYTYDDLNRIQKVEYESGTVITYEYDNAENIEKVTVVLTNEQKKPPKPE